MRMKGNFLITCLALFSLSLLSPGPAAGAMDLAACKAGAGDVYPPEAAPGLQAQEEGLKALRHRHLQYAIDRFKVAASWGAQIADYNLGLMYWNGLGVTKDHAKAVAWLALADQRHNSARIEGSLQFAYAKLTAAERAQANSDFNRMVGTYGDAVALKRAREAWRDAARSQTGSRLGAGGDLSGGAGIEESALGCNQYWPYPLKEQLTKAAKASRPQTTTR